MLYMEHVVNVNKLWLVQHQNTPELFIRCHGPSPARPFAAPPSLSALRLSAPGLSPVGWKGRNAAGAAGRAAREAWDFP